MDKHQEQKLFDNLRAGLPGLSELLGEISGEWAYEDYVYRFYHQSFKVFRMQDSTLKIVAALQALMPEAQLNQWFMGIIAEGTVRVFDFQYPYRTNQNWLQETRPIVEAFMHAKYMLEMAVKYGAELGGPVNLMPSGWAAFLYLYGLR